MKGNFLTKHFVFIMLLLSVGATEISARPCFLSNCFSDCNYESCGNPLNCGCFNIQAQAGVAPIVWTKRGCFQVVSCNAASLTCAGNTPVGPLIPIFGMPSFSKLFRVPWTVGGKLGYALSDNTEVFLEFNYRQARAKDCFTSQTNLNLGLFVAQPIFAFSNVSKYKFYDVYLGARYYFDACVCDRLSFFLGGQVGLAHHKGINATITSSSASNTCAAPFSTCADLFGKHTGFAGGANLGAEYCICNGLSLVLTAEVLATCGPNGNPNICFPGCTADVVLPELRPTNFVIGNVGTELLFPVTLGLKYSF